MRYKIILQKSEEGYSVSCPGLPGCWSQGATEAEALENIQDAIREYLAAVDDLLRETPETAVREVVPHHVLLSLALAICRAGSFIGVACGMQREVRTVPVAVSSLSLSAQTHNYKRGVQCRKANCNR